MQCKTLGVLGKRKEFHRKYLLKSIIGHLMEISIDVSTLREHFIIHSLIALDSNTNCYMKYIRSSKLKGK